MARSTLASPAEASLDPLRRLGLEGHFRSTICRGPSLPVVAIALEDWERELPSSERERVLNRLWQEIQIRADDNRERCLI